MSVCVGVWVYECECECVGVSSVCVCVNECLGMPVRREVKYIHVPDHRWSAGP